jgi:thioredoxin reductase
MNKPLTRLDLPVAIIGAGPVGLAAAAHLLARGKTPIVLESGDEVGHAVRRWAHVRMFSPWEYNLDKVAASLLRAIGWQPPPLNSLPTGAELVASYLAPLASLPALRPHIRLGSRVVGVTRKGFDKVKSAGRHEEPFVLRVIDRTGRMQLHHAQAVIDASGTWLTPNPAGADGLPALNEADSSDRISYGIPDVLGAHRRRYAGEVTTVIGGGHSAINVLIDLAALKREAPATRVIWVTRKQRLEEAFGGGAKDGLPARGELGRRMRALVESGAVEVISPFRVTRIDRHGEILRLGGERAGFDERIETREVIVATGFRPHFSFLREIRLTVDPWLESSGTIGPLIDPNLHSCGTVRPHGARELAHAEPDFFIAGMKSYGRAPTFLLATGYEQVRSIAAELAGDGEAARNVHLVLPETGVCRTTGPALGADTPACCGGPAIDTADACCARDEEAKASGSGGCGCGSGAQPQGAAVDG